MLCFSDTNLILILSITAYTYRGNVSMSRLIYINHYNPQVRTRTICSLLYICHFFKDQYDATRQALY